MPLRNPLLDFGGGNLRAIRGADAQLPRRKLRGCEGHGRRAKELREQFANSNWAYISFRGAFFQGNKAANVETLFQQRGRKSVCNLAKDCCEVCRDRVVGPRGCVEEFFCPSGHRARGAVCKL
jgi:hypothetical protein